MRQLLVVILFISCILSSHAENHRLVLEHDGGLRDEYLLAEKPVLSFSDGVLDIRSETLHSQYSLSSIGRYFFEEITGDGIVDATNTNFSIEVKDNVIQVYGTDYINIYSLSGSKVSSSTGKNKYTSISINTLDAGVYIVETQTKTIKIIKK